MSLGDLNHIISRFKIGDPIKVLFNPRFYIAYLHERKDTVIQLKITAPDSDGIKGNIDITFTEVLSSIMNEREFFNIMRKMLHGMLIHEADESITVDEHKVYDPHA